MKNRIITIDGPSGVGKGTISTIVSTYFGFRILDSGALYRIAAVNVIENSLSVDAIDDIVKSLKNVKIHFEPPYVYLNGVDISEKIRTEIIGQTASKIAVYQSVRDELFQIMRGFITPVGLVADGRDMGTVVFPEADLKLFLTASTDIRAERRHKQLVANGKDVNINDVFSDLAERDKRDTERTNAPLIPDSEAVIIDTGTLDVLDVFELVKYHAAEHGILP